MNRAARFYIILMLCLTTGMQLSTTDEGDVITAGGSNYAALFFEALTFLVIVIFCLKYRREIGRNLRHVMVPMVLPLLVLASTVWSLDPGFTLRRAVPLVVATFGAFLVGMEFDPAALTRLYIRAFEVMVYASVLVIGLVPSSGISHGVHSGDWKGAFYHKNRLGMMMALAIITFVVAPPERLKTARGRVIRVVTVLFGAILLYKSHSSSAIVSVAVAAIAQLIWYFFQLRKKILTVALLIGYPLIAVIVGVIMAYSSQVFVLLGKDSTLSGRDTLWAGVIDAIKLKPLLGYGYLAFFNQVEGSLILVQERTTFQTSHSHNGYLNLMLHVGVIGLAIFAIFVIRNIVLAVQEGRRRVYASRARWFFSFIVYMLVTNSTESQILEQWYFMWLTLVAFYVTFSIERANRFAPLEASATAAEEAMQLATS